MLEQERGYNFNFMRYVDELTKAMNFLAKDPRTIFVGQAVEYPGTAMTNTLKNIPKDKIHYNSNVLESFLLKYKDRFNI